MSKELNEAIEWLQNTQNEEVIRWLLELKGRGSDPDKSELKKCGLCGSEAEPHSINKIYVHCSNPECILSENFINREKWNRSMHF